MTNKELSNDLKKKAIALGLCSKWQNNWTTEDKDKLCNMYIEGIDFCIINNYPTCEYMKANFDGVMQQNGIFVDDKVAINRKERLVYVLNGSSCGYINFEGFDVCEVYVRHNSNVKINIQGQASVYICAYDNAKVDIEQSSNLSRVKVFKYSNDVTITQRGSNISIKEGKMG